MAWSVVVSDCGMSMVILTYFLVILFGFKKLKAHNIADNFVLFQGVGGTVQFPKNFLKKAFDTVKANGGVCISDEVIKID